MEKFVCNKCGECCRNIMGLRGEKEVEEYKKDQEEEKAFYNILKPEELSILIFDWEKPKLKELANDMNIALRIIPRNVVLSPEGNPIVIGWDLNYNICPFLKGNECSIYENRPLICQSFPLYESVYNFLCGGDRVKIGTLKCPKMVKYEELTGKMQMIEWSKKMFEVFGDAFISSVKCDIAKFMINFYVTNLIKSEHVFPYRIDKETVIKKCQKSVIGLCQFMLNKNLISQGEINEIPNMIENVSKEFLREGNISESKRKL